MQPRANVAMQQKWIRCISHTKILECGLPFAAFGVTEYMWCVCDMPFKNFSADL